MANESTIQAPVGAKTKFLQNEFHHKDDICYKSKLDVQFDRSTTKGNTSLNFDMLRY